MPLCPVKSNLIHEHGVKVKTYVEAVKVLGENTAICATDRYIRFQKAAKQAREDAEYVQRKLVTHIEEHHCGVE